MTSRIAKKIVEFEKKLKLLKMQANHLSLNVHSDGPMVDAMNEAFDLLGQVESVCARQIKDARNLLQELLKNEAREILKDERD